MSWQDTLASMDATLLSAFGQSAQLDPSGVNQSITVVLDETLAGSGRQAGQYHQLDSDMMTVSLAASVAVSEDQILVVSGRSLRLISLMTTEPGSGLQEWVVRDA